MKNTNKKIVKTLHVINPKQTKFNVWTYKISDLKKLNSLKLSQIDFDNFVFTSVTTQKNNTIIYLNFDIPYFLNKDDENKTKKFIVKNSATINLLNLLEWINKNKTNTKKINPFVVRLYHALKSFSFRIYFNKKQNNYQCNLKPEFIDLLKNKKDAVIKTKIKYNFKLDVYNIKNSYKPLKPLKKKQTKKTKKSAAKK